MDTCYLKDSFVSHYPLTLQGYGEGLVEITIPASILVNNHLHQK